MTDACRGFLNIATLALSKAVDSIFSDLGTVSLLKQLYCTPEWVEGIVTPSWLATLRDYFKDLRQWLDGPFFKRAVQVSASLFAENIHRLGHLENYLFLLSK